MIFSSSASVEFRNVKSKDFADKFYKRFGTSPNFAAVHSYEAAYVLFKALKDSKDYSRLKDTILKIRRFSILDDDIVFNEYGDVQRQRVLITVKNGEFVTLK
ncbi:MAG: hypothetical protein AB1798_06770 [Spirochaetota bacterium]